MSSSDLLRTITSLDELVTRALATGKSTRLAVACCAEDFVIQACLTAYEQGLAEPVFVGDMAKTHAICERLGCDISVFSCYDVPDPVEAVTAAIQLFREGRVAALMKGKVNTDVLLRGILNKVTGVPPQGVLSHVGICNAPQGGRLLFVTDAGINIAPNMQRKVDILKNALHIARALGVHHPRVAMLAATEKVIYPAMPATLDAQLVAKMAEGGEFGDAYVEGPLSLDLAVSPRAVACKGIESEVAGHADILVAPDIESGNLLYKSLAALMNADMASVVAGSAVPLVLPSRGDTDRTKFYSIALATLIAQEQVT